MLLLLHIIRIVILSLYRNTTRQLISSNSTYAYCFEGSKLSFLRVLRIVKTERLYAAVTTTINYTKHKHMP